MQGDRSSHDSSEMKGDTCKMMHEPQFQELYRSLALLLQLDEKPKLLVFYCGQELEVVVEEEWF